MFIIIEKSIRGLSKEEVLSIVDIVSSLEDATKIRYEKEKEASLIYKEANKYFDEKKDELGFDYDYHSASEWISVIYFKISKKYYDEPTYSIKEFKPNLILESIELEGIKDKIPVDSIEI